MLEFLVSRFAFPGPLIDDPEKSACPWESFIDCILLFMKSSETWSSEFLLTKFFCILNLASSLMVFFPELKSVRTNFKIPDIITTSAVVPTEKIVTNDFKSWEFYAEFFA